MTDESFRTLYCDPGEDFGWAVAAGHTLLARGIHKMWEFADIIWDDFNGEVTPLSDPSSAYAYDETNEMWGPATRTPIERVVCEDFRIYPWKAKDLAMDPVRTARVIGAITFMCRKKSIPLIFQGANIKKAAQRAGVSEFYDHPLYENRHSNDALQHYAYFVNTQLLGRKLPLSNEPEDYS